LDDLQSLGGRGEALVVRDRKKVLEMTKLHPAIITVSADRHQKISLALIGRSHVASSCRAHAIPLTVIAPPLPARYVGVFF
jgi:hypothetical protein